jgi:uncharacterized protein CbrC (UPF0167 family)
VIGICLDVMETCPLFCLFAGPVLTPTAQTRAGLSADMRQLLKDSWAAITTHNPSSAGTPGGSNLNQFFECVDCPWRRSGFCSNSVVF